MSTAINDDAYRFAPAISLHNPPPEESEVVFGAAQRHLFADRQDSSDVPVMSESIAQRRRETVQRCTEEAKRLRRKLMFGMTTSLALQSVPLPADCDLELDVLHTVSSTKAKRVRVQNSPLRSHVWKPVANVEPVRINQHVFALDLFHTWAQLAVHVSLPSLVALGDAIITSMAGQPKLAQGRDAEGICRDLQRFANELCYCNGKSACVQAAALLMPHVDSPKETECRLLLQCHGLPCPSVQYEVPDVNFKSGVSMTLDMAWPEYRVGLEYDGDHHRTNKLQWRRDQEKRDALRGRGWMVITAIAPNLADDAARAELAFNVARQLALRGADVDFRVVAMSVERLAALRKRSKA